MVSASFETTAAWLLESAGNASNAGNAGDAGNAGNAGDAEGSVVSRVEGERPKICATVLPLRMLGL